MARVRRRFEFRGHVQGVGFRATTSWLARGFEVGGFVRNLPSGAVEVVAEGEPDEVNRFLTAILDDLGDYVQDWDQADEVLADPLTEFQVRV